MRPRRHVPVLLDRFVAALVAPPLPTAGRNMTVFVDADLAVVPHRAHQAHHVAFVALVSLLLPGGVVGLLLFNTELQQGSFTASALEERAAVLAGKEESLQMQLDRLRDPQHIATRAKELGMVPASSPAFIRLSDGKVLGRPTVTTSADSVRISPLPAKKPESLRRRVVIRSAPERKHPAPWARGIDATR